ncbi:MAG: phospho-sugar mutase [Clostridiales bacterium]|nr:phospho-sugar mutase [Clostridiales bacterium]
MEAIYKDRYNEWLISRYIDDATKKELSSIKDMDEIKERFCKDLEFGTAGLRGIIGAGTNRMNIYTVRKASFGLADHIKSKGEEAMKRGVVIAYDSRFKSYEFAEQAAMVLTNNGIKVYLFDELRPVPELSFAVRYLKAEAGIVITASHNPKEYNGYKVYGSDGAQISLQDADKIANRIDRVKDIFKIEVMSIEHAKEKKLLEVISSNVDDVYINNLKTLSINPEVVREAKDFKIVYTPIHGTGNKPVRRILKEIGFSNVLVVKEQELPDCEFRTVEVPNPENMNALTMAIDLAKKENVDLVIGTDPDCDRVGIAVKNSSGDYIGLTGNQIGSLLMDYILSQKDQKGKLPKKSFVVKTIVTTELARKIAYTFGVHVEETLTGFKYIGQKIKELDENGDYTYLFGFEESYGYLAGTFARDKDGVVSSMLIAEMAAYYNKKGMTLYDALQALYKKYGYYLESVKAYTLKGLDGQERIKFTMNELRYNKDDNLKNLGVLAKRDYKRRIYLNMVTGKQEKLDLPESDVLYYELGNNEWFCVRPSGTEPKIKVYFGAVGKSYEESNNRLKSFRENVLKIVEELLYN